MIRSIIKTIPERRIASGNSPRNTESGQLCLCSCSDILELSSNTGVTAQGRRRLGGDSCGPAQSPVESRILLGEDRRGCGSLDMLKCIVCPDDEMVGGG